MAVEQGTRGADHGALSGIEALRGDMMVHEHDSHHHRPSLPRGREPAQRKHRLGVDRRSRQHARDRVRRPAVLMNALRAGDPGWRRTLTQRNFAPNHFLRWARLIEFTLREDHAAVSQQHRTPTVHLPATQAWLVLARYLILVEAGLNGMRYLLE